VNILDVFYGRMFFDIKTYEPDHFIFGVIFKTYSFLRLNLKR